MAQRRRAAATFAEIVRKVKQAPAPPPPQNNGRLIAPDGRSFFFQTDREGSADREVTPEEALKLVVGGALVAWDYCGGLGGRHSSPLDWFDECSRAQMVTAGPPQLRHTDAGRGQLLELCAEDGQRLVLAMFDVRWGDLMY